MCAATGSGNPVIFAVISVLVVALVYSPATVFDLNASLKIGGDFNAPQTDEGAAEEPPAAEGTASRNMGSYTCTKIPGGGTIGQVECCAVDLDTAINWCTTCDATNPPSNCGSAEPEYHTLPNANTVPKGGIFQTQPAPPNGTVPSGGTFEVQQIPLSGPAIPPGGGGTFECGGTFNTLPPPTDEGAAGAPPPTAEEMQSPTLTEEPAPPVCVEGQVLDEQTNLCVLEEPEQSEVEEPEQQSSEEGDGTEDSNNDNDDDDDD